MDAGHRAGQGRAVPDTGLQGFRAFTVLPSVDRRACCADFSSCFLLPAPGLQSSGGLVSGCLRRKRRQRSARCWQSASTARQPRRPGRAQSSHCAGPLCAGRHQGCRGRKRFAHAKPAAALGRHPYRLDTGWTCLTLGAKGQQMCAPGLVSALPVKAAGTRSPVLSWRHGTLFKEAGTQSNHAVA